MIPNPWLPLCGSPDKDYLEFTFKEFQKTAEVYLKSGDGKEISPMLIMSCKDSDGRDGIAVVIIQGPFDSQENKDQALGKSAEILFGKGIYPGVLGLLNEAWTAPVDSKDHRLPSKREKRDEALVMYAETVGGGYTSGICKFARDEAGKPVPGEWSVGDSLRQPKRGIKMSDCHRLNDMSKEEQEKFIAENFESPLRGFWDVYRRLAAEAVGAN